MNYYCKINSPIGPLTAASDGKNLTGLWIEGQKHFPALEGKASFDEEIPLFAEIRKWLDCYFSGAKPDFTPPLAPVGTVFRQSVWRLLREIPYGSTATYGEIASRLSVAGINTGPRAVGGAVGHNPISLIIPCHRVLGKGGTLTGYAAGIDIKLRLLALESNGNLIINF